MNRVNCRSAGAIVHLRLRLCSPTYRPLLLLLRNSINQSFLYNLIIARNTLLDLTNKITWLDRENEIKV